MIHTIESYLPIFPGFYGTIFEADEEPMIEDGKTYDDYIWDYEKYQQDMAIRCTDKIQSMLKEIGVNCIIKFEEVISPREYNFSNDSINVEYRFTDYGFRKVMALIHENKAAFIQYLKDNYTSCSGFISFISNNISDWSYINILTDRHKLGSVLDFLLYTLCDSDDLYYDLFYACEDIYINSELKEQA